MSDTIRHPARHTAPGKLMPGAEPIYIDQGDSAILFLHGFTSSAYEGRFLAEYFAARGMAVWAPLMPGHGSDPADMVSVTRQDWLACAEEHLLALKRYYPKVVLCGQSMGGALAVNLAARHEVDALVTLAAAMFVKDWRLRLLPVARRIITYQHKSKGPDIRDPQVKAEIASYAKYPISSLESFLALIAEARELAPRVTAPALLVHARRDHTIAFENLDFLFNAIQSPIKEQLILESAYHVISVDVEREIIFERMAKFLEKLL
ncbi:MAG: alpha/beta fold hydrolase [Calditrichaeota bacterium]|nr:alpha/beta fold hydrolase [Calditrichota bacterium]HQU73688.1 alpha/beta fold hydrolase [Calditrichia bacterium]